MKIAVCLYGHLRTWEHCYESLKKNLLDLYDCDVFMHTWSTIDHTTTTSWHGNKMAKNISTFNLKDKLIEKYSLKDIKIEEQEKREDEFGYFYYDVPTPRPIWSVHCLWHSIANSYKLMQEYKKLNAIEYDFVLFVRPDLFFDENINVKKYIEYVQHEGLDKSFFCFARTVPDAGLLNEKHYYGGNDLLFFAKPNIISNILDNSGYVFNYIKDGVTLNRTPESIILDVVENLNYNYYVIGLNRMIIARENTVLTNDNKNGKEVTRLNKHKNALISCLKAATKIPSEIISTLYYLIINK